MDKEIEEGLEIFEEQKLLNQGDWEKFECPNCKAENWLDWEIDFKADVCICYVCGERFWVDSNSYDMCDGDIDLGYKVKGKKDLTD